MNEPPGRPAGRYAGAARRDGAWGRFPAAVSGRAATAALVGTLALLALGPPAAGAGELRLFVEADGTVRQDDNYLQRGTTAADDTSGEEKPDAGERGNREHRIARAGLRFDLSYRLPRTELALVYSPTYEESLDDSNLSGLTQMLRFGLTGDLSRRSKLTLSDRLVQSRNFESVALATPPVGGVPDPVVVTRRGDQLWNAADVGLDLELTRLTSVLLGASHTLRTFEENDLSDSSSLGVDGGVRWRFTEQRSLQALVGAERFDFETDRESEVLWGSLGYNTDVARDGRFHIEAGGYRLESREEPRAPAVSHTGVRGGLGISFLREFYSWSLGYRHGVSAGIGLGRAALVDSAYAGISTVGRKVTVGLAANASRTDDSLEDGGTPGDDGVGRDRGAIDTAAGTLRASWSFASWGRLTAGYSRIWQRADLPPFEDLSYSRYFVGFGLRLYESGERPKDPAELGETRNAEPVAR